MELDRRSEVGCKCLATFDSPNTENTKQRKTIVNLEDIMRSIVTMTLAACAVAVMSSPTFAQMPAPAAPPAPPSAGGTPDAMPFDIPYGVSIGLERAKQVMAAAEAEAKKRNWKMNIAVVDTNGELVQFERMEGAQIASGSISIGKARTAARFRRESRTFYNAFETGHGYVSTLDPTLVASPGGFPLVEGGKLIGAVGCSGGTGDQDAAICKVGAEIVK
jgi:glc operon protein GlcG